MKWQQIETTPSKVAPFTVRGQMPTHLFDGHGVFAAHAADHVRQDSPLTVREILLVPEWRWDTRSKFIFVYAFGTFRSPVSTLIALAEAFATATLASGILPLIQPVLSSQWLECARSETGVFRKVSRQGMAVLSR